ncbi:S8 family serine peptidase [Haliangium sp.]|uniref:S8 family serine peptidase n=1 Tax=Haliangium sp. TaxID=2663208 RepID=UPI003D099D5C
MKLQHSKIAGLASVALTALMFAGGCNEPGLDLGAEMVREKVDRLVLEELESEQEADFWVVFADRADLSGAAVIDDWTERGQYVYDTLVATAEASQAGVQATLDGDTVSYQSYWIANVIFVKGGSEELVAELASDAAVERITADETMEIEPPQEADEEEMVQNVEWGIARIRAPEVWSTFGVEGEDIVVANIDTGVDYTHPALVAQYRGNQGSGQFDHAYNWFDPSSVCPTAAPCDNNSHGTHTMGTMVGDDDSSNQIGVAPGAKWIAAKGCESGYCSQAALLASGQWLVAPTDLSGQNPRPDLRPHIINNSWGGGSGNGFYQQIVDSWVAAGIFPAFSAGNSGSYCGSANSPGDYVNSYASGAFDSNNSIAYFSSRGPSVYGGETKPNIAAPGVNVRSSIPGGGYGYKSGTSMASPHTAGAVALIWSAAPALVGDIEGTRALLDSAAIDTAATYCGGDADDNNVFGEGRLDVFAAVDVAPRGPTGTVRGTVTAQDTGAVVSGARVQASGQSERVAITGPTGDYELRLPVDTYEVTVQAFGYLDQSITGVAVAEDQVVTNDATLVTAPIHAVAGHVYDDTGAPVANVTVTIVGTPIAPTTTDAGGAFGFASVPQGQYQFRLESTGRCFDTRTASATVDGVAAIDLEIPRVTDAFGYSCSTPTPAYVEASNVLPVIGDDRGTTIDLPFSFPFYGGSYDRAYVCSNGYVSFDPNSSYYCTHYNRSIPTTYAPNAAIYPLWDDLYVDYNASVRTEVIGTAPNRQFVIEWRNVRVWYYYYLRVDFEVILHENSGRILMQYRNISTDPRERGSSATVGIENGAGDVAFEYSYNEAAIEGPEFALEFRLPPSATVHGVVSDHNDDLPISGATVRILDNEDSVVQTVTTAEDGSYSARLVLGKYSVQASADNYAAESVDVDLDTEDELVALDFSLETARAELDREALSYIVLVGESRRKQVTLSNTGTLDLVWEACAVDIFEQCGGVPWLAAVPSAGTLAPGESVLVDVVVDTAATEIGVYDAPLRFITNSGRQPTIQAVVDALVVAYRQGVNAGNCSIDGADSDIDSPYDCQPYIDGNDDEWSADQAWAAGSWGYIDAGSRKSTSQSIAEAIDELLYQTQRAEPYGYRFDDLPDGVYQIEMKFAELTPNQGAGERLFDLVVENEMIWPAYDIVYEAGVFTAHDVMYFVAPLDGRLDIRLIERLGAGKPVINALRVTHRPDM